METFTYAEWKKIEEIKKVLEESEIVLSHYSGDEAILNLAIEIFKATKYL